MKSPDLACCRTSLQRRRILLESDATRTQPWNQRRAVHWSRARTRRGPFPGGKMPQNLLEQLRTYTTVVADTGDIDSMEKFRPTDATTNPSLITTAAQMPQYQPIVDSVHHGRAKRNWAKTRATRMSPTWPFRVSLLHSARRSWRLCRVVFRRKSMLASPMTQKPPSHRRAALLRNTTRQRSAEIMC